MATIAWVGLGHMDAQYPIRCAKPATMFAA